MKINTVLLILSVTLYTSCHGQEKKKQEIEKRKEINYSFDNVYSIKLYKYNPNNLCNQSKAISIIKNDSISPCFDYIKTIDDNKVNEIMELVKNPNTYAPSGVACFDTDYAMLMYNVQKEISGYVNLSFNCNQLISNPKIDDVPILVNGDIPNNGFSEKGRKRLLKLLGL